MTFREIIEKAHTPKSFKDIKFCETYFESLVKTYKLKVENAEDCVSIYYKDTPVMHIYPPTEENDFYPQFSVYVLGQGAKDNQRSLKFLDVLGDVNDPMNTLKLFYYSHCEAIRVCKQMRFLSLHVSMVFRYVGAYINKLKVEDGSYGKDHT